MARTAGPVVARSEGPVRTLILNRPSRLNAFTAGSYRALARLLDEADCDPGIHVVLLQGAGRSRRGRRHGAGLALLRSRPAGARGTSACRPARGEGANSDGNGQAAPAGRACRSGPQRDGTRADRGAVAQPGDRIHRQARFGDGLGHRLAAASRSQIDRCLPPCPRLRRPTRCPSAPPAAPGPRTGWPGPPASTAWPGPRAVRPADRSRRRPRWAPAGRPRAP